MIIELHMLQNFAPSCLNRDDTNSPKECLFGGYRRARISSQCIKRAIREEFKSNHLLPPEVLASRTKLLVDNLVRRLVDKGKGQGDAQTIVPRAIRSMGLALDDNAQTQYLFFLGEREFARLADLILSHWSELAKADQSKGKKETTDLGKEFLKVLDGGKAADLALFGRMLADLPDKNIDAACQVAHAISTNRVNTEFDFYTAVDDLQPKETAGAGMMGTVEFNSACYYRYANVDLKQLKNNLGGDEELARKTVEAFLGAAVTAIPTGKQTSMSAQNPPSFIFAVVRDAGAWSLANAFAKPVSPSNNSSLIQTSVSALVDYWGKLVKVYGGQSIEAKPALALDDGIDFTGLDRVESLEQLIDQVKKAIAFHR